MGNPFPNMFNTVETDTNLKQNEITKEIWLLKLTKRESKSTRLVKDGI